MKPSFPRLLGRWSLVTGYWLLLSCRATTSRPAFIPLPSATSAAVELEIPAATRALAETLAKDSVSLATIREADGYIDSGWLDAVTLERTGKRPLGRDVVRVRAWINPSKLFWSELVVEATYRPLTDPSRPERELDAMLPEDHPLQRRIAGSLRKLIEQYGDADALKSLNQPKPAAIKPESSKARKDSSGVKRDTLHLSPSRHVRLHPFLQ